MNKKGDSEKTVVRKVTVINKLGFHARPAARFAKEASVFESDITISNGTIEVNGKSLIGLLGLEARCGTDLTIRAKGCDAQKVVGILALVLTRQYKDEPEA